MKKKSTRRHDLLLMSSAIVHMAKITSKPTTFAFWSCLSPLNWMRTSSQSAWPRNTAPSLMGPPAGSLVSLNTVLVQLLVTQVSVNEFVTPHNWLSFYSDENYVPTMLTEIETPIVGAKRCACNHGGYIGSTDKIICAGEMEECPVTTTYCQAPFVQFSNINFDWTALVSCEHSFYRKQFKCQIWLENIV